MNAHGNRSFVRTTAFLVVFGLVFAVSPVTAVAGGSPAVTVTPPATGSTLTVDEQGRVVIPLTIEPLTSFTTGTLEMVIRFRRNGNVISEAVYSPVPSFVYSDLPTVLHAAYKLPSGFGGSGVKFGSYAADIVGSTVYLTVYVDESAQQGGVGVGGSPVIGGTTGTGTGWQTYNPSTDTTTVYVDPEKTGLLYRSAPPSGLVLVEPPKVGADGAVPSNVNASLPLAVVNQGGGASVPSILDMGSVQMTLSPAVMQALARDVSSAAGAIASLKVKVETSTQQQTEAELKATGADLTNLATVSRVITVSFVAVDAQGRETALSVSSAAVSVRFNPDVVRDPAKVNLYVLGSLIYAGGKVDIANHTVTASMTGVKDARVVALEYNKTFPDVDGHWAQPDVELMASKHVVKGVTETEFQPDRSVTRAEFLTLLVRSLGLSEHKPAKATFSDVAPDAWYYGYVEAACRAGLAFGDTGAGGAFRPGDTVSREEMAAFLVRAMKQGGREAEAVAAGEAAALLSRFSDTSKVSGWATTEVAQAVNEGLMKGRPDRQLDPLGTGSRAEAATVMSRFMKQIGRI